MVTQGYIEIHQQDDARPPSGHRWISYKCSSGRRDRYYEHHVSLGERKDLRGWFKESYGSEAARYSVTISGRICAAKSRGRRRGNSCRLWVHSRRFMVHEHSRRATCPLGAHIVTLQRTFRYLCMCLCGHLFWLLPGVQSIPSHTCGCPPAEIN